MQDRSQTFWRWRDHKANEDREVQDLGVRKGIRVCGPISVSQEVEELEVPADFWQGWGGPGSHVALHLASRRRTVIWRDFAGVMGRLCRGYRHLR